MFICGFFILWREIAKSGNPVLVPWVNKYPWGRFIAIKTLIQNPFRGLLGPTPKFHPQKGVFRVIFQGSIKQAFLVIKV